MLQLMKKPFNKKQNKLSFVITSLTMLISLGLFSQNNHPATQDSLSIFSNTLFNIFLGIITLLLIIIIVLASVLKNVAEATKDKYMNNKTMSIIAITSCLLLINSNSSYAQQGIADSTYMGLSTGTFYLMISIVLFELIIIAVLLNSIQLFIKKEQIKVAKVQTKEEPSIFEKLNASVAVEEEASIMMDHDYDGIKELDNNLPPWWKYGFYFTILFGFVYLVHYHITRTGDLQTAEYNKSIIAANIAKEEYQKKAANSVNENTVTLLTDATQLEKGQTIFKEICSTCHGANGEGNQIGPNLTDDYWLHGGSIKDIFSSIKYGWPNKGMISWQAQYSPSQIQQISSYIKSLRGTNPANAKEKQGELYIEETNTKIKSDSIAIDSANTSTIKVDTTAITNK